MDYVYVLACVHVPSGNKGTYNGPHNPGAQGAPWEQPNQNLLKGTLTKRK